jgi:tetratricopeptide (TPR) repeat protein
MPQIRQVFPLAALSAVIITPALQAQSAAPPAAPAHKHYEETEHAKLPGPRGEIAPRLQNLGSHAFDVDGARADAQKYISQAVNLAYGFNHAEAGRSFREAARLQPDLAMAYWGQALVLGPNINAPMDPETETQARELAQKALSLASTASPRDRALIEALATRYTGNADDRAAADAAYAEAMRSVHQAYLDDPDVAMLYVESVMDLMPWAYWTPDGRPQDGVEEIVALTERVMARHPIHPLALHLYIHLIEPTSTPQRAEVAADTLATLMPGAGHMVHMPSHIYQRIGRYADGIAANQRAVLADEDYITQCRAQGLYPMGYYPHNIHFLWFAATADGQSRTAIDAARKVSSKIDDGMVAELPMLAAFRVVPYWALTRFGHWDEMLAEPEPSAPSAFLTGAWHYARGLAFAATDRIADARAELEALQRLMPDESLDAPLFSPNTGRMVLGIGPEVLAGEIAAATGDYDTAVAHLEKAVRLEDALAYTEPSEWHYPPRLALGAVLLAAGRPAEAETVYWEDLRRNRDNGWALFGLGQALRAQNKQDQAAQVESRFRAAWARADVTLDGSRFGGN